MGKSIPLIFSKNPQPLKENAEALFQGGNMRLVTIICQAVNEIAYGPQYMGTKGHEATDPRSFGDIFFKDTPLGSNGREIAATIRNVTGSRNLRKWVGDQFKSRDYATLVDGCVVIAAGATSAAIETAKRSPDTDVRVAAAALAIGGGSLTMMMIGIQWPISLVSPPHNSK